MSSEKYIYSCLLKIFFDKTNNCFILIKLLKILLWFVAFHNNMKDLINDLGININHVKIVLCNVFNNINRSEMWF
jgi:hypothetical protein